MNTTKKIRWFWSWKDQEIEQWLSDMSAQGLHLLKTETPFWYTFVQSQPANVVYRLDYYADTSMFTNHGWYVLDDSNRKEIVEEEAAYQQLFEDAGWHYRGTNRGWNYFSRTVEEGHSAEIFTDIDSKVKKYRRQLLFQLATLLSGIILIAIGTTESMFPLTASSLLRIIVIAAFAYPLLPITQRMRQLQQANS